MICNVKIFGNLILLGADFFYNIESVSDYKTIKGLYFAILKGKSTSLSSQRTSHENLRLTAITSHVKTGPLGYMPSPQPSSIEKLELSTSSHTLGIKLLRSFYRMHFHT